MNEYCDRAVLPSADRTKPIETSVSDVDNLKSLIFDTITDHLGKELIKLTTSEAITDTIVSCLLPFLII